MFWRSFSVIFLLVNKQAFINLTNNARTTKGNHFSNKELYTRQLSYNVPFLSNRQYSYVKGLYSKGKWHILPFINQSMFLIESVILNLRRCLFPYVQTNWPLLLLQARQFTHLSKKTMHVQFYQSCKFEKINSTIYIYTNNCKRSEEHTSELQSLV